MTGMITLGLLNQQLAARMGGLSREVAAAANAVATGKPDDVGAAAPQSYAQLVDREGDRAQVQAYLNNAETYVRRTDLKQTALTDIINSAQSLLELATGQLPFDDGSGAPLTPSAAYNPDVFAASARGALEQILAGFNTADGRSFLFSGVDADAPALSAPDAPGPLGLTPQQAMDAQVAAVAPVDAASATALAAALDAVFEAAAAPANPAEDFTGAFHLGAPAAGPRLSISVGPNATLDFGLQADDAAARQVLQGAYMLAAVDLEAMDPAALPTYAQEAVSRLAEGLDALRVEQSRLGESQRQAEAAITTLTAQDSLLQEEIAAVSEVDAFDAQLRYTRLEQQLSLMFEVVARAGRLSLFQYLR